MATQTIHSTFWGWKGSCNVCGKRTMALQGIFCANFVSLKGHFEPCQKTWCAGCYKMKVNSIFPWVLPTNDEGIVFKQRRDPNKCLISCKGDWLGGALSV
eukprot:12697980-Ditylum_brightwellii.AAC.1